MQYSFSDTGISSKAMQQFQAIFSNVFCREKTNVYRDQSSPVAKFNDLSFLVARWIDH